MRHAAAAQSVRAESSTYWHCTDWPGFRAILQSREITPNTGERRFRHGLSHLGACAKLGGVALFDGGIDPRRSMFNAWISSHRPITVAFKLDASQFRGSIVDGRVARKSGPGLVVPGEVCHIGPVPWGAVLGCMFVRAAAPEQRAFLATENLEPASIAHVIRALRRSALSSQGKGGGGNAEASEEPLSSILREPPGS